MWVTVKKSFPPQHKRVNMFRVKKRESKSVSQGLISVGFKWVVKAEVEEGKTEEEEEGEDEVFSMQSALHDTRAGDRTWMLKQREKAGRMRDGGGRVMEWEKKGGRGEENVEEVINVGEEKALRRWGEWEALNCHTVCYKQLHELWLRY